MRKLNIIADVNYAQLSSDGQASLVLAAVSPLRARRSESSDATIWRGAVPTFSMTYLALWALLWLCIALACGSLGWGVTELVRIVARAL